MKVTYLGVEADIPDLMVAQYVKEFDGLPGGDHTAVLELRSFIAEVFSDVAQDPELLYDRGCLDEFVRCLAMRSALETHGLLYDA
jgi:hypothetical protein